MSRGIGRENSRSTTRQERQQRRQRQQQQQQQQQAQREAEPARLPPGINDTDEHALARWHVGFDRQLALVAGDNDPQDPVLEVFEYGAAQRSINHDFRARDGEMMTRHLRDFEQSFDQMSLPTPEREGSAPLRSGPPPQTESRYPDELTSLGDQFPNMGDNSIPVHPSTMHELYGPVDNDGLDAQRFDALQEPAGLTVYTDPPPMPAVYRPALAVPNASGSQRDTDVAFTPAAARDASGSSRVRRQARRSPRAN